MSNQPQNQIITRARRGDFRPLNHKRIAPLPRWMVWVVLVVVGYVLGNL